MNLWPAKGSKPSGTHHVLVISFRPSFMMGNVFPWNIPNIHAFLKSHWINPLSFGGRSHVPFWLPGSQGNIRKVTQVLADLKFIKINTKKSKKTSVMIQCVYTLPETNRSHLCQLCITMSSQGIHLLTRRFFFQLRTCERNSGFLKMFTIKSTILKQFSIGKNWNYPLVN